MKDVIYTDRAPDPVGPYSQAIRANGLVFCSGQVALPPAAESGGSPGLPDTVEDQARGALDNLKAVLAAAGSSLEKVVKTTIFLTDMGDFESVNKVYGEYFPPNQDPPARATVEVSQLPKNAQVEIELVALE